MQRLKRLTQWLSDLAAIAIAAMILLTIADIAMKNLFKHPIKGTFELVELLLVFVVFFGFAEVFRSDSNISVDVADQMLGAKGTAVLRAIGAFASLVFLLLMGWAMLGPAMDTLTYPQWTQELGIPLYAYWAPILAGTALAIIASAGIVVLQIRSDGAKGER
ncbi:MAG: TRAP transporter small permease [Xanthobacteraceae bacterium]